MKHKPKPWVLPKCHGCGVIAIGRKRARLTPIWVWDDWKLAQRIVDWLNREEKR